MVLSGVRRIIRNTISMLASGIIGRAATFMLYALTARHLGVRELGQMSLALTFFYIFQVLASAGLKTLVTRAVAKQRDRTADYLVTGTLVVVIFSLISLAMLFILVRLLRYPPDTAYAIFLMSLGLLPFSMTAISEAILQAWERMHFVAYATIPVSLIQIGATFLLLSQGYGLYALILVLLVSYTAITAIEWWWIVRNIGLSRVRISPSFTAWMVRSAFTFLSIDVIIAVSASLNVLLMSKLVNETELGLYSAASQLLVPVALVSQSIVLSFFPIMCRLFEDNARDLGQISEHLVELLLSIAVPSSVGLFVLADAALSLLYGKGQVVEAAAPLRIMAWGLIFSALTSVLGQILYTSLQEKITLRIVAIDTAINLAVGLILISQFGVLGAALTAMSVKLIDIYLHYRPVSNLLPKASLLRLVWKPAFASTCMGVYLVLMRGQNLILTIMTAGLLYAVVFLGLVVWSVGGPRQIRARYLYLRRSASPIQ